ncbi:MAG TPA: BadF/BadG/BcrA/BcrD ATPase family protein [Candidatus Acidoferrales bacterium]|nr:BadF/BadG/BcrA/BcrD ATPase family protein [Candidatus Acidoferrales bacterium]
MAFYLGIDCGGSQTRCAVGDHSRLLGIGRSGGANIVRLGPDRSRAAIQTAILTACEVAAVPLRDIVHTCIGAAGISAPGVKENLRKFAAELVASTVEVVGDHEIALEAAFSGGSGVIVEAGTGSIAFGRNAEGKEARCGGYGFAISDEGSGHWIGRTAVSLCLRASDEGTTTLLKDAILETWGIGEYDLVKFANMIPPPNFAELFPVVMKAADAGDAVAVSVLRMTGEELAELVRIVMSKLWAEAAAPVAMLGGVLENSTMVRAEFARALSISYPAAQIQSEIAVPVVGALSLARKQSENTRRRLDRLTATNPWM